MQLLGDRAKDIYFTSRNNEFEAIGYLANPARLEQFEAQIPEDKVRIFEKDFPGQMYYTISIEHDTSGGYKMKNGVQLRLYLKNTENVPEELATEIVNGNRINRGTFSYRLLKRYGFVTGYNQDPTIIRNIVALNYPEYLPDFNRGFSL